MTTIDDDRLREFATELLVGLGAPDETARAVATSLVGADLRGHTSHGVLRIPTYGEMIDDGALVPDATPTELREDDTTAVVDGRLAFGQVVGREAVDVLTEKTDAHGVACVGIRNATHLGRIGEWAERLTDEEFAFVSLVHTSGGGLVVAPAGTATRRFSTNPVTYGMPTFDGLPFPLVLDMASSQVAHGKISEYEADGRSVPGEWLVAPDGTPMTDPAEMGSFREGDRQGAIRPLGGTAAGHKGTGLAVVAELFAGLLGGGPVAGQRDPGAWFSNGATFLAMDPLRFGDRETMGEKVATLAAHFRAAESFDSVPVGGGATGDGPLLPGEAEHRTSQQRSAEGVPLPEDVTAALSDLAADLGVENPLG